MMSQSTSDMAVNRSNENDSDKFKLSNIETVESLIVSSADLTTPTLTKNDSSIQKNSKSFFHKSSSSFKGRVASLAGCVERNVLIQESILKKTISRGILF